MRENINTYYNKPEFKCQDKPEYDFAPAPRSGDLRIVELAQQLRRVNESKLDRNKFYADYLRLCQGAARAVLSKMNWRGDLFHDAQDVASECVRNLIAQQERGGGVFSPQSRTPEQLRGYLTRTIYRSCRQRALKLMTKAARQAKIKQGLELENTDRTEHLHREYASQPWRRLALKEAMESMLKTRWRRLPKGITPLHCILDDAVGEALIKGQVPVRTLQRYTQQARQQIAARMGIDLKARERQLPWQSWKHHRQAALQRDQLATQTI